MRTLGLLLCAMLLVGCQSPTEAERKSRCWYDLELGKRDNCWGYRVGVEVSDPGCRIELNGEHIATLTNTTGEIILWGYKDGKFRERQYVRIVANPVKPGQHQQTKTFLNLAEREYIPRRIYFDLNLEQVKPTDKIDVRVR